MEPPEWTTLQAASKRSLLPSSDAISSVSLRTINRHCLACDDEVHLLSDVRRMITHPLQIARAEQQVRTRADVAGIFHHIGQQFPQQRGLHSVDLDIPIPYLLRQHVIALSERL